MREALDEFCIRGVTTNIPFLSAVMGHPRFQAGDISTGFIAEEFPDGFKGAAPTPERLGAIAAVAAVCHHRLQARGGTGRNGNGGGDWVVVKNGERIKVTVAETAAGYAAIGDFGSLEVVGEWRFGEPIFRGTINDRPLAVQIEQRGIGYRLVHDGLEVELQVMTPRAAELAALMPEKRRPDTSRFLLSPMPGLLSSLAVGVAEEVKAGQALAVVEAMKMENVLRAERDGRVVALLATPGDSLATDQPIIEFEWA
jgi:propionyl-CoA carboxylase alpha chain